MKKHIQILCFILFSITSFHAQAAFSPLSVNIIPPVQFPPSDYSVTGLRISPLVGDHRDMYGLDLAVIGNITEQDFVGLAVSGLFNITKGTTTAIGLQLAGITNVNYGKTNVYGAQLALGMNVNTAESSVTGLQLAVLGNIASHTKVYGMQIGLYNRALAIYGFQIGLVNVATNLHGIQIGLINFHSQGLFAMSPIINIGF